MRGLVIVSALAVAACGGANVFTSERVDAKDQVTLGVAATPRAPSASPP